MNVICCFEVSSTTED